MNQPYTQELSCCHCLSPVVNIFLGSALPEVESGDSGVYVMVIYCLLLAAILALELYLFMNRTQKNLADYWALVKPKEDEIELQTDTTTVTTSSAGQVSKAYIYVCGRLTHKSPAATLFSIESAYVLSDICNGTFA